MLELGVVRLSVNGNGSEGRDEREDNNVESEDIFHKLFSSRMCGYLSEAARLTALLDKHCLEEMQAC
jgi:hypothetical protein